jgi:RNA polymerase sigma-70 factor (ECF subfamily)
MDVVTQSLVADSPGGNLAQNECATRSARPQPVRRRNQPSEAGASRTGTGVDEHGVVSGVRRSREDPAALLLSDPALLGRFRSGDPEALSRVYWSYSQGVESYIRRGLLQAGPRAAAGLDAAVADLVQEAFAHAFAESARRAYDETREYGRFLIAIARNTLIDHLRRQSREEPVDPVHLEHLLDHQTSTGVDESPWTDSQLRALVQHYLAKLPERERAVYLMRYAQDQSQLQAADALGLTRQQVRTLEERVRAGLARELARARIAVRGLKTMRSAATKD